MLWKALSAWAIVCALAAPAHAVDTKAEQLVALDAVLAELKTHYGMIRFKETHFGLSYDTLRAKYAELVNEATTLEEKLGWTPRVARDVLPADEFRQLLVALGAEFRDGHLNVSRQTRRRWTTGIRATAIDGRLYIVGFEPDYYVKGRAHPEPKVGDEIVEIDGVPVQELAEKQMIYMQTATYRARFHEALELLVVPTHRWGRPKETGAPVAFTFERPAGKGDGAGKTLRFEGHYNWVARHDLEELKRFRQFVDDKIPEPDDRPYYYGDWATYDSFFQEGLEKLSLPTGTVLELGQLVNAQIDEAREARKRKSKTTGAEISDEEEAATDPVAEAGPGLGKLLANRRLHVQIVRYEGKQIGILRIPDYVPFTISSETQWLRELIQQLENATDVLVIDQLTNAGGYVWQFAELAGMFGHEKPMNLGTFEVKLSETFFSSYEFPSSPDFDHEKLVNDQRLNFAHLTLHKRAMETLRRRFDAGERWSGPLAFGSPHSYFLPGQSGTVFARNKAVYTKPVLILNDQRSASGGDFFPAAMQANGRAVIFGETSQGLGGPVYRSQASMPGSEMTMRCTYGVCLRADGLPIENVGVVPDVLRPVTVEDLRGGFSQFAKDALKVAARLAAGDTISDLRAQEAKAYAEAVKKAPKSKDFDEIRGIFDELRDAANTETDPGRLAERYRDGFERLRRTGFGNLERVHWRLLRLPIPLVLAKTDPILASLAEGDAIEERLREMLALPRYAEGTPLRPLVAALHDGMPTIAKARVNPCVRELATPPS